MSEKLRINDQAVWQLMIVYIISEFYYIGNFQEHVVGIISDHLCSLTSFLLNLKVIKTHWDAIIVFSSL